MPQLIIYQSGGFTNYGICYRKYSLDELKEISMQEEMKTKQIPRRLRKMQVKELLDYIQEDLNNGRLTPESKVRIRDNWGDDYPINCIRAENNELILADFGI